MRDTDLAWLAGIWDGEGTVAIFTHTEKTGNQKICPCVSVVNTDIAIINKVRKILEELDCNFTLQERRPKNSRHSTAWVLVTRNMTYIIKFLEGVMPYLTGNKQQSSEIIYDYCVRRQEKMERVPSKGSTPYDEEDWSSLEKYDSMNFRRSNNRSSSTTRETLEQE